MLDFYIKKIEDSIGTADFYIWTDRFISFLKNTDKNQIPSDLAQRLLKIDPKKYIENHQGYVDALRREYNMYSVGSPHLIPDTTPLDTLSAPSHYTPYDFHRARDTIEGYMPPYGMSLDDSLWYGGERMPRIEDNREKDTGKQSTRSVFQEAMGLLRGKELAKRVRDEKRNHGVRVVGKGRNQ